MLRKSILDPSTELGGTQYLTHKALVIPTSVEGPQLLTNNNQLEF